MSSTFTDSQITSATKTWLELVDFIILKNPQIKIYAKLHPRIIVLKNIFQNALKIEM